jgi:PAS domain S-box-containing protein
MPGVVPPESLSLADLLDARRQEILERWLKRVEGRLTPAGLSRPELVDSLPDFLAEVVATLRRHSPGSSVKPSPEVKAVARVHGKQRYRVGSDINAVVWEYGVLRDVLLELFEQSGQPLPVAEWHVISHAITTGIAEAVSHFTAEREKALRTSEARLQAIIDGATAHIYAKDAEGRYLLANRLWKDAFHGGREVVGRTDHEVFPPSAADEYRANDLRVLRTDTALQAEESITREDGPQTFLSVKFPLRDAEGRPYAVCGISTDITDRKRAEAERQRALDALEHGDACVLLDPRWRVTFINRKLERMSRTPRAVALGRDFWELYPGADHPESPFWREYHRVMEQRVERFFEAYYAPLDLWAAVAAYPMQDGGIALFFRDISERRRQEAARSFFLEAGRVLAGSLELDATLRGLVSLVVEHLADYCTVDLLGADGQLHRVQVAARDEAFRPLVQRLMAYPADMNSDSPVAQILKGDELLAVPEVTPEFLERSARNADHRAILDGLAPKSVAFVPLRAHGRKLGLINFGWTRRLPSSMKWHLELAQGVADQAAVAIDNARLYREAQEAARLREEVVAIVSHDLRTPLGAISLSATALLQREGLGPEVARGIRRISASTERAVRMIGELLDFTQARVGALPLRPGPANFHELARQVVEEVQLANPKRSIHLETAGDGQGTWDVDRMAQVLTNVVGNAVQHSPPDTPVRVSVRGEGEAVVLEVHNRGKPIPAELLPTLFEPFRRGQQSAPQRGSVGLGLYISRQVVLGHGGHIDVRSTEEEGTTFTLRLPRGAPAR